MIITLIKVWNGFPNVFSKLVFFFFFNKRTLMQFFRPTNTRSLLGEIPLRWLQDIDESFQT